MDRWKLVQDARRAGSFEVAADAPESRGSGASPQMPARRSAESNARMSPPTSLGDSKPTVDSHDRKEYGGLPAKSPEVVGVHRIPSARRPRRRGPPSSN
jgi:hypothetical protein